MSLLQLFDPSLLGRAGTPALEFDRADVPRYACTFGELEARSNRFAHVLRARGLGRGDRLAFFLGNRVEIIDLWLAGVKLGLLIVPINILYRERELRHILTDSAPAAVVSSRELAAFIPAGVPIWDVDQLAAESAGAHMSHVACASPAQVSSHSVSQQKGLAAHTASQQVCKSQPGVAWAE